MIKIIPPIKNLVIVGADKHSASVSLRRGGAGGAGIFEFFRHGAVVEEGEAGVADGVEEGWWYAVVGDVEAAPFAAGV